MQLPTPSPAGAREPVPRHIRVQLSPGGLVVFTTKQLCGCPAAASRPIAIRECMAFPSNVFHDESVPLARATRKSQSFAPIHRCVSCGRHMCVLPDLVHPIRERIWVLAVVALH